MSLIEAETQTENFDSLKSLRRYRKRNRQLEIVYENTGEGLKYYRHPMINTIWTMSHTICGPYHMSSSYGNRRTSNNRFIKPTKAQNLKRKKERICELIEENKSIEETKTTLQQMLRLVSAKVPDPDACL